MSYLKWMFTTLSLITILAALIIAVNFYVDYHAARLILFNGNKEIHQTIYPDGINQHMFNPELIFRNPEKFDSFLFGSSRISVIDVAKIPSGRFYNMFYSEGLPAEHLAILKVFLQRGVKIRSVVIGLDDFCFNFNPSVHQKQLLRMMHPDVSGECRAKIFGMYFFRKPNLNELTRWRERVLLGKTEGRIIINSQGVNLGGAWPQNEKILQATGKPIFHYDTQKYEPISYDRRKMDEAFKVIEELIALSRRHHLSLTFFINPFYSQLYLNNAEALLKVKERLAQLTDYYDFSGFNSVTTDAMNYYEESHYRYRIGDMIVARIFGDSAVKLPDDFGVLVTKENVAEHLKKQKLELEKYLADTNLEQ